MNTSGYLARLVQRATQPATGVRPRVASMFEPTGIARVLSTSDPAGPVYGREQAPAQTSRRELPAAHREGLDPEPSPAADLELPVTAAQFVASTSQDQRSPASSERPGVPVTPGLGQRADVPAAAARLGQAGGQAAPTVPPRDVAPRRGEEPVWGTAPAEVRQPVDAAGRRDQGPQDPPVAIPSPTPPQSSPGGDGSRGIATGISAMTDPDRLPRLHAVRTAEPAVAKPDITVTIGRIEVLQPTLEPPAPRAAPPGKGGTAPDLAQYLHDRSGR